MEALFQNAFFHFANKVTYRLVKKEKYKSEHPRKQRKRRKDNRIRPVTAPECSESHAARAKTSWKPRRGAGASATPPLALSRHRTEGCGGGDRFAPLGLSTGDATSELQTIRFSKLRNTLVCRNVHCPLVSSPKSDVRTEIQKMRKKR